MRWTTAIKWPVEPTPKYCVIHRAPLWLRRSKNSLETQHFWEGAATQAKQCSLTRSSFVCRTWNQVENKTNSSSLLSSICPLTAYFGKQRNLLLAPLHAFTKEHKRRKQVMSQFHCSQQAYVLHSVNPALNIYITASQQTVLSPRLPAKVIAQSQAAAALPYPLQGLNFLSPDRDQPEQRENSHIVKSQNKKADSSTVTRTKGRRSNQFVSSTIFWKWCCIRWLYKNNMNILVAKPVKGWLEHHSRGDI